MQISTVIALALTLSFTGGASKYSSADIFQKFDEYEYSNCEDSMARLDNLATSVQKSPDAVAYVIIYGASRGDRRNETQVRVEAVEDYLVKKRGLGAARVKVVPGGHRLKQVVELWLWNPKLGSSPLPTPAIDLGKVRYKGGRASRAKYDCHPIG